MIQASNRVTNQQKEGSKIAGFLFNADTHSPVFPSDDETAGFLQ